MCAKCSKRLSCSDYCKEVSAHLKIKGGSGHRPVDTLDNMLYMPSWNENHRERIRIHIIAVLSPFRIKTLRLLGAGITQIEAGKIMGISQAAVSQRLETIKRQLGKALHYRVLVIQEDS